MAVLLSDSLVLGKDGQQSVLPIDLPAQTAALTLRVARPTTGGPVVWDADTTLTVAIIYELDGEKQRATFTALGGVLLNRGSKEEAASTVCSWTLPWGFFGTDKVEAKDYDALRAKRIGETAKTSYRAWVEWSASGPLSTSFTLSANEEAAPADLRYHHSIAFENAASIAGEAVATLDLSFTANTGSNRAVCVSAGTDILSAFSDHVLTYGGAAPTITRPWNTAGSYARSSGDIWIDSEIGSGAKTIHLSTTGGNTGGSTYALLLAVTAMSGVDQTTPAGTGATDQNDAGGSPSCTVGSVGATDLVVDGVANYSPSSPVVSLTAGANQTQRTHAEEDTGSDGWSISMSTQSGADGGVMSWSSTGGGEYAHGAVAFKAATGGGSTYDVSTSEAGTATDADSAVATFAATRPEAGSASDSNTNTAVLAAARSEAGTATDTPSTALVTSAAGAESATATDTSSGVRVYTASATEAGAASETQSNVATLAATRTEAGTATDAPSTTATFAASDTEGGSASDTETTGQSGSVTEATSATDTPSATASFAASGAEAGSATDTDTSIATMGVSRTEAASATDSSTGTVPAVAQTTTASDVIRLYRPANYPNIDSDPSTFLTSEHVNIAQSLQTLRAAILLLDTTNTPLVNAADDTAAAAGGVPLNGLYHTAGAVKVRLV